jgi:GTP diphosphokinase / guanosine-3',5'-bis(diphosphate) 3'-diphosphatase
MRASENGLAKPDDLLAAIGYGKFPRAAFWRAWFRRRSAVSFSGHAPAPTTDEGSNSGFTNVVRRVFGGDNSAIKVKGHDDLMVYRARCCNPIRGEEIVGYVTRGKGVAVHSLQLRQRREPDVRARAPHRRRVGPRRPIPVKLTVYCDDRFGMLKNITGVIGDAQSNIRNIGAHRQQPGQRGDRSRHLRPETPRTDHGRSAQNPRRA